LRRALMLLLIAGCFAAPVAAQTSSKVVKVKTEEDVYKVKPGSPFQIAVVIEIDKGYHINSNRPAEDFLIATSLKVEPLPGLRTNAVRYPKAKLAKFEFSEKPMSVYEDRAVLRLTARALPTLAVGKHTIKAKLTVQACNDQACLRPETVNVSIPLEVSM
jgi:thiol:disulfide interchange protein DsbD